MAVKRNVAAGAEEMEVAGGSEGKRKREKAGFFPQKDDIKSDSEAKNSAKKADKRVRKKKRGLLKWVLIVLLLLALGGFLFGIIRFDLFDLRTGLIDAVNRLDPAFAMLDERSEALDAREAALGVREAALDELAEQVERQKTQLQTRETQVQIRESGAVPVYRRPMTEEDLAHMESLSKVYASMEAEKAAEILASLYSVEDAAAILYHMAEARAGDILAAMKVDLAAKITQELLRT